MIRVRNTGGSLPAAELQYRLSLRDAPRHKRMNRLNGEINNRAKAENNTLKLVRQSFDHEPVPDSDLGQQVLRLARILLKLLPELTNEHA